MITNQIISKPYIVGGKVINMAGALLFFGIGWFIIQVIKEAGIKPCPPETDHNAALSDCYKNNLSKKEFTKRIDSGYYVKKK